MRITEQWPPLLCHKDEYWVPRPAPPTRSKLLEILVSTEREGSGDEGPRVLIRGENMGHVTTLR